MLPSRGARASSERANGGRAAADALVGCQSPLLGWRGRLGGLANDGGGQVAILSLSDWSASDEAQK